MNHCKNCGKEIPDGKKFCSKTCLYDNLRKVSPKKTKLSELSNENKCIRCGKLMHISRISAYCEVCERDYSITYDTLNY